MEVCDEASEFLTFESESFGSDLFYNTISNGGVDEFPRISSNPITDNVKRLNEGLNQSLMQDGKVHFKEKYRSNSAKRFDLERMLEEGNVPGTAIRNKYHNLFLLVEGFKEEEINMSKILGRPYTDLGEGHGSRDLHGMPRTRRFALEQAKEYFTLFSAKRIVTIEQFLNAMYHFLSYVSGQVDMNAPYTSFEKRLVRNSEFIPIPRYIRRLYIINKKNQSSGVIHKVPVKQTIIIGYLPIDMFHIVTTASPVPKMEKRQAEVCRVIDVNNINIMCAQYLVEGVAKQSKNPVQSVTKSNEGMFSDFEMKTQESRTRGTKVFAKSSKKKRKSDERFISTTVVEPLTAMLSGDDTKYNYTISDEEWYAMSVLCLHKEIPKNRLLFNASLFFATFRKAKMELNVNWDGYKIKLGCGEVCGALLRALKTYQRRGVQSLVNVFANQVNANYKGNTNRNSRFILNETDFTEREALITLKNPGKFYMLLTFLQLAVSTEAFDTGFMMCLGFINGFSNWCQSITLLLAQRYLRQFGHLFSQVMKVHKLLKSRGEEVNPCPFGFYQDSIKSSLEEVRRQRGVTLILPLETTPHQLFEHFTQEERDLMAKSLSKIGINSTDMTDIVFPDPKELFEFRKIPLYRRTDFDVEQKSDDSITEITSYDRDDLQSGIEFVVGSHLLCNRKLSCKKSILCSQSRGTLYSQFYQDGKFVQPVTGNARAILPTGLGLEKDLTQLKSVVAKTSVAGYRGAAIFYLNYGRKRLSTRYKMWRITEPLHAFDEKSAAILDLHLAFEDEENIPEVLGGYSLYTILNLGAMEQIVATAINPEYFKIYYENARKAETITEGHKGLDEITMMLQTTVTSGLTNAAKEHEGANRTMMTENVHCLNVGKALKESFQITGVQGNIDELVEYCRGHEDDDFSNLGYELESAIKRLRHSVK